MLGRLDPETGDLIEIETEPRPYGIQVAEDGTVWVAYNGTNKLGALDPETMEVRYYTVPNAGSRIRRLGLSSDGMVWYVNSTRGRIGRLNPATGEIKEWDSPSGPKSHPYSLAVTRKTQAGDPHSATFHPNGLLYFTAQRAGMLGRLDPETGDLIEIETEPRPYGIQVAEDGTVWVAYNGTNKLGALDPETMEVRYYTVPNAGSRIRRLGLSSDGMVWYVNSTRGRIGRLNPATGEIKEWDSPSGPKSHPYSLAVIDDKIWYNESGMRPDALVRFDPKTESFQSWAIPSGVGIIRHVWVTRDGNLLIHQTSSNRVGQVTIKKDLVN